MVFKGSTRDFQSFGGGSNPSTRSLINDNSGRQGRHLDLSHKQV